MSDHIRAVEVLRIEVAKLALRPGDVLLVKVPESMEAPHKWEQAMQDLGDAFPSNRVILTTKDIEFSVVSEDSAPG